MGRSGVLIVSGSADPHAKVVAEYLNAHGTNVAWLDLARVARSPIAVVPGSRVAVGGADIEDGWVVWWRRAGLPAPDPWTVAPPSDEELLASAELRDIVLGGLLALGVAWVDELYAVLRPSKSSYSLLVLVRWALRCLPPSRRTRAARQGPSSPAGRSLPSRSQTDLGWHRMRAP